MADELWQRSAVELAAGIREKAFSCREVMASVTARIAALNGTLNVIVFDYSEEAMAEGRRADDELAAAASAARCTACPSRSKRTSTNRRRCACGSSGLRGAGLGA
jgi:Asp-tRNA(Asn)/Glu-tRNA(Gln) amidotransferase A subunit family amidase